MTSVLRVQDLKKYFPLGKDLFGRPTQVVHAVESVSFDVKKGRTLGIVGESGCGKSTTARLLMHLIEPDEGRILIHGKEYGQIGGRHPLSELRKQMQMVFQDSYASLNPRLTIEDSIAFGPRIHGVKEVQARQMARDLLERVGLNPGVFIRRYPHELSGGQRQRVNIARALAIQPEIVILDEAVSALDKSVQAQVLNLLADLKKELGLTYLFISHDLNVVQYISDDVMVMYLGQVVESGPVEQLYRQSAHPYTRALLNSVPAQTPGTRKDYIVLEGDPPNPIAPPSGCRFHPRCEFARAICSEKTPDTVRVEGEHRAACFRLPQSAGHQHYIALQEVQDDTTH
ncbi:ABC transporter ATP-binding protein [Nitrincola tapanii]|uniref:Glutathione import ATP-binding protein GsiA n=1 Tax=Nitrincola tapanii TaxID=1708751 RepID=A0A5A9W237_9GAMM|nr:oligopeptide/dipeptide ABC transporter ATP-binding protein [Nitrincola tapanii]KAA0874155.1 ATP-binding cassette domain-containing protein [Nitrincola tapanii]